MLAQKSGGSLGRLKHKLIQKVGAEKAAVYLEQAELLAARYIAAGRIPSWRELRADIAAEMNIGGWVGLIIGTIVLVFIVAALFPTLNSSLASWAANESSFGPILVVLVPLLIGAGVLLLLVRKYLSSA